MKFEEYLEKNKRRIIIKAYKGYDKEYPKEEYRRFYRMYQMFSKKQHDRIMDLFEMYGFKELNHNNYQFKVFCTLYHYYYVGQTYLFFNEFLTIIKEKNIEEYYYKFFCLMKSMPEKEKDIFIEVNHYKNLVDIVGHMEKILFKQRLEKRLPDKNIKQKVKKI